MEYLMTGFSPAVDAFAFSNSGWSIDEDEAAAILDVVRDATLAALAVRPPLVDALFDGLLLAGPFLAIPQVRDLLIKQLADYSALDAAKPAFCCGMCFCALDAYHARQPSTRGVPGRPPTRRGTPHEAAVRANLLERHLAAWRAGAAWTAVESKLVQRTRSVDAVRRRSAREVARVVAALRTDSPTPILIHQDSSDPFSSHCLVAYGAAVHPPAAGTQTIELYVYDPNQPILSSGVAPDNPDAWSPEVTLTVVLDGTLAQPTAVRSLQLSGSGWSLIGLSTTPYTAAAPSPSVAALATTSKRAGRDLTVAFHLANYGIGEIGPFVVGARSTIVVAAPGRPDDRRDVVIRVPRPGGGPRAVDGPNATVGTVTVHGTPSRLVSDRTPNPPVVIAPDGELIGEVTFAAVPDVIRVAPILSFVWRSRLATLRDPSGTWKRSYERRPSGPGLLIRPPQGGGLI